MTAAVRAPQSKPAMVAVWILSASMRAMMSCATADCWALRMVVLERKVVVPEPRRYGTITRYPLAASKGATSVKYYRCRRASRAEEQLRDRWLVRLPRSRCLVHPRRFV